MPVVARDPSAVLIAVPANCKTRHLGAGTPVFIGLHGGAEGIRTPDPLDAKGHSASVPVASSSMVSVSFPCTAGVQSSGVTSSHLVMAGVAGSVRGQMGVKRAHDDVVGIVATAWQSALYSAPPRRFKSWRGHNWRGHNQVWSGRRRACGFTVSLVRAPHLPYLLGYGGLDGSIRVRHPAYFPRTFVRRLHPTAPGSAPTRPSRRCGAVGLYPMEWHQQARPTRGI